MPEAVNQVAPGLNQEATSASPIYSDFGGDEDLGELVEMYVDEMPDRVQALAECFQAKDLDALARLAHQLKGASGSYGFMQISNVAAQLELALKNNMSAEEVEKYFAETIELCGRAKAGTPA